MSSSFWAYDSRAFKFILDRDQIDLLYFLDQELDKELTLLILVNLRDRNTVYKVFSKVMESKPSKDEFFSLVKVYDTYRIINDLLRDLVTNRRSLEEMNNDVKFLLKHGANPNISVETANISWADGGDFQYLVENDHRRVSLLNYCLANFSNPEIIETLIIYGANVNTRNNHGNI